jgi:parvulin-like peptidyl-prolyl isomerase
MKTSPKRRLVLAAGVLVAAAVYGEPAPYVARVAHTAISEEEFTRRAQELMQTGYQHIRELTPAAKMELLEGMIAQELLVLEGLRRGLDREPAIAQEVQQVEQRLLMNKLYEGEALRGDYTSTEEELKAFLAEKEYDTEVLSQHIVCATEEDALTVLAALNSGQDFATLVPAYSTAEIQRRFGPKGWLGWFKIGELLPELKEPLKTMEVGWVYAQPVRTMKGYHVFQLHERRPFDLAAHRAWAEEKLRLQKRANHMEQYVKHLRQQYRLAGQDEALNALGALGAEAKEWPGADQVLFRWQGGQLTAGDYMAKHQQGQTRHPASLDSAELHKAAENLAGQQIMMAEARRLQYDDAEVQREVAVKRNELMVKWLYRQEGKQAARGQISETEVRAYYDANPEMFTRDDGQVTDFAQLRDSIGTLLKVQAENRAMDAFIAQLREKYKSEIEIHPEALAAPPPSEKTH